MASLDDPTAKAETERLYQLPLDRFITARNELAKRAAGGQARAIRTLAKPNVLAWALNQLYWTKRETFDRLVAASARLRATQAKALLGKRVDLRTASDAHREAIREALRESEGILDAAGHGVTPDAIRELTGAFEALPWKDAAGRLVRPPTASGFAALAGLPVAAHPPARNETPPAPEAHRTAQPQTKGETAPAPGPAESAGARRKRAATLEVARAEKAAARREEARGLSRLQRAEKQVKAAREREEAARAALADAEHEHARAKKEAHEATAALDAARRAAADAADRLDVLQRP
jgi:hypothetical protein